MSFKLSVSRSVVAAVFSAIAFLIYLSRFAVAFYFWEEAFGLIGSAMISALGAILSIVIVVLAANSKKRLKNI